MADILVVVDFQNDFVRGPLGTEEARAIIYNIKKKCQEYADNKKMIVFTFDCHDKYYEKTLEGKCVPLHCMMDTSGWELVDELKEFLEYDDIYCLNKSSYGSENLIKILNREQYMFGKESVEFVGVCTDICVVSNVLMCRSMNPYLPITVDASCCAGTTPENHLAALKVMQACNVRIIGE